MQGIPLFLEKRTVWRKPDEMTGQVERRFGMKKGQIIEGIVQRVDFPNKGIVESAEGICMVKNALP